MQGEPHQETCNEVDDDCDGQVDDSCWPTSVEIPCNGKDDDGDGAIDEGGAGLMASCDQCPFVAEPVNLLTRQMYVTSRTAASIDVPVSPDHSLKFEVGYDSPTAKTDAAGNRSRPRSSSPPPVFWRNGSRTLPMPSSSPPGCAQRRRCIPPLCANPVNGYRCRRRIDLEWKPTAFPTHAWYGRPP